KHSAISARGARDLPSLPQIDIQLWRRNLVRRSRLYLDKAKRRTVVKNQIDFRVDDRISCVTADRQAEIRCHDSITNSLEVLERQRLAALSQLKVRQSRRRIWLRLLAFKTQAHCFHRFQLPSWLVPSSLQPARPHLTAPILCFSFVCVFRKCHAKSCRGANVDLLCPSSIIVVLEWVSTAIALCACG